MKPELEQELATYLARKNAVAKGVGRVGGHLAMYFALWFYAVLGSIALVLAWPVIDSVWKKLFG